MKFVFPLFLLVLTLTAQADQSCVGFFIGSRVPDFDVTAPCASTSGHEADDVQNCSCDTGPMIKLNPNKGPTSHPAANPGPGANVGIVKCSTTNLFTGQTSVVTTYS